MIMTMMMTITMKMKMIYWTTKSHSYSGERVLKNSYDI